KLVRARHRHRGRPAVPSVVAEPGTRGGTSDLQDRAGEPDEHRAARTRAARRHRARAVPRQRRAACCGRRPWLCRRSDRARGTAEHARARVAGRRCACDQARAGRRSRSTARSPDAAARRGRSDRLMPIPLVTRILVADDHAIVRSGLKKVLDAKADMEVVAEAEDGAEAVKRTFAEDIHLAILDVSMPKTTGIQAAEELHKRKPELKLLMLSMYDSEQFLFEALKAGASGYVLKSDADHDVVDAVRRTMRGQSFLYPSAISSLVKDFIARGRTDDEQFDVLTPRELQVLKLIAEAYSSKEIAKELVISIKTVERHRQNILDKLGMSDRVELTRYAIRRGLIQP